MTVLQLDDAIDELVLDALDTVAVPDAKPTLVPAVIQPALDGEVIVPATVAELADAADRIHKLVAGIGDSMFEIGKELVAIKAKLEHGEFGKWVKASLTMTEDGAALHERGREVRRRQIRHSVGFADHGYPEACRPDSAGRASRPGAR